MLKKYAPGIIFLVAIAAFGLFYEKYLNTGFIKDVPNTNLSIGTAYYFKDKQLETSNRIAINYYTKGEFKKAKNIYEKMVVNSPDEPNAHYALGVIQTHLKDFGGAETSFNNTLKLKPNTAPALFGLGNIASWRKEHNQSISFYKKTISVMPNHAIAHYGIADQYYIIKNYALAVKHYKKVIKITPNSRYAINAKNQLKKIKLKLDDNNISNEVKK